MNKIFSDYSKIDVKTPEGRKKMFGAIAHFCKQPAVLQAKIIKAGITAFTTDQDFGQDIKAMIERLHLGVGEIDVGYQMFFDSRDFSGTKVPGFSIREVQSGLTFSKVAEGGRAKIYPISGTESFVGFDMYGGGLEYSQSWFEDEQWWEIEDTTIEFRNKWYRDKATTFYTLIGAIASGYNVAYNTTESSVLEKDIATINAAAAALLSALKTLGYAVTPSTQLVVLSPLQLRGRLQRALATQYITPAVAGSNLKVEYNIVPVYSMNVLNAGSACTDKWYMGVPGLKNKIGEKMPLTVYTSFDIEAYATMAVGWGRYGACLNAAQFRRIATA